MTKGQKLGCAFLAALIPVVVYGFSSGPPPRRTGAPVDENGTSCNACHRGADLNSGPGFVRIEAASYRPGQRQTLRVTVSHPEAIRWGFQLTARLAANPAQKAGTFSFSAGSPIRITCDDGSIVGQGVQTCGPATEFASHGGNPESTTGGVSGAKTFEVDWTAPDSDLGDVIFYAAGNAANGNNNNVGDRIYNSSLRVELENTCNFVVSPRVQGVGNAATSFAGVAANTLLAIAGNDFVPAGIRRTADAGVIRDNKFPKELSCIAVEIAGQRVPVLHVQNDQINVQVPAIPTLGPVPIRVIVNPGRPSERAVEAGTVTLSNFGPAFLTFNGTSVAARHADFSIAADPAVVPGGRPLVPGDVVLLYATGLGPTEPRTLQAGDIAPTSELLRLRTPISVIIGGTTVPDSDILFAGATPGSISGLNQINLRIPTTAPAGNTQIRISIGGVLSPPTTTLPIAQR